MRAEITARLKRQALESFYEVLPEIEFRTPRTPREWARAERRIGQGGSPLAMDGDIPFDESVLPWCAEPMDAAVDPAVSHLVLWFGSGMGKALSLETPLPTSRGWVAMRDIREGETLFDENGEPCRVTKVKEVMLGRPCFVVRFGGGAEIVADAEHLWRVHRSYRTRQGKILRREETVSTAMLQEGLRHGAGYAFGVDVAKSIRCETREDFPISPYMLGVWLGDGDSKVARVSSAAGDAEEMAELIRVEGHAALVRRYGNRACEIKIDSRPDGQRSNSFIAKVRALLIYGNKRVPKGYLRGSAEQRLALLQGLMDTDGTVEKTGSSASFCSTRETLADSVFELVASLGMKPRKREAVKRCQTGAKCRAFVVSFFPSLPVFRLRRKLARIKPATTLQPTERRIIAVEECASVPVRCIAVDSPSRLFLCGRAMIPTHNTDGVVTNLIGWGIHESPRNIMALYPNEPARDKWSRDVLQRTIDATPALRERVAEKKGREAGNTIAYKAYPGGSLYATAAGSPSNLRGPRVGLAYAGEVDAMPDSVGREGDPLRLLFRRCEGFPDAIKIVEGTATIKGKSRIEAWYLRTDQRKWLVPCRRCGNRMALRFTHLRWPKNRPDRAEIECDSPRCSALHNDAQRLRMVRDGHWRPTSPFTGMAGFWISGFNSTLPPDKGYRSKLHQFAAEWVDAAKSETPRESLRTIINTVHAETDEDTGTLEPQTDWSAVFRRFEPYAADKTKPIVAPEPVRLITGGMDVQGNRVEAISLGWAEDEQVWALEHEIFYGKPTEETTWDAVEKWLLRPVRHEAGVKLEISMTFVDRGRWTDAVDKFCARPALAGRVFSCKGANEMGLPIVGRIRPTGRGASYFRLGTDAAKDYIFGKLTMPVDEPGKFPPGYIHFPKTFDQEFAKQLCAERPKLVYERGQQHRKYVIVDEKGNEIKTGRKRPNEGLDIMVYAIAAFRLRAWNWEELNLSIDRAKLARDGKQLPPEPKDEEDEGEDFVSGWRK